MHKCCSVGVAPATPQLAFYLKCFFLSIILPLMFSPPDVPKHYTTWKAAHRDLVAISVRGEKRCDGYAAHQQVFLFVFFFFEKALQLCCLRIKA